MEGAFILRETGGPADQFWGEYMGKVKCRCLNCGWVQWVEDGDTEDCQRCGMAINSKEDVEE